MDTPDDKDGLIADIPELDGRPLGEVAGLSQSHQGRRWLRRIAKRLGYSKAPTKTETSCSSLSKF